MNRATRYLWATSVALVLSASPVFAAVIKFPQPAPVSHVTLVHADALNPTLSAKTAELSPQTLSNKSGNNVVKFTPKGVAKVPPSNWTGKIKNVLKANPARLIAAGILVALVSSIPDADWDGYKLTKKGTSGTTTYRWGLATGGSRCGFNTYCASAQAEADAYVSWYNGANSSISYSVRLNRIVNTGTHTATAYFDSKEGSSASWASSSITLLLAAIPFCGTVKAACDSSEPRPLTDAELEQMAMASLTAFSEEQAQKTWEILEQEFPGNSFFKSGRIMLPSGAYNEQLKSAVATRKLARLQADGSTLRLTERSWSLYDLTSSPEGAAEPSIEVKTTNVTETTNDATGEKVEEEVEPEEEAEVEPELSPALDTANDPLRDWAVDIQDTPSNLTGGISYPLLFTYGGTCLIQPVVLPVVGSYSMQPICDGINNYVKPVLAVLFGAWTIFSIFGIWRETTLHVRPV